MFLLFFFFLFLFIYISYAIVFKEKSGIFRIEYSFTVFFFLIFIEFFSLLFLGIFKPFYIFIIPFLLSLFVNFFVLSFKNFFKLIRKDFNLLIRIIKAEKKILLFLPVLMVLLRVSILPPLGWDALTCHLPKAVLWAKYGKFNFMECPGGFNFYQTYFAGGSILPAYVLAFFKNDLLLNFIDIFYYFLLFITIFSFLRKIKTGKENIFSGTLYFLTIPTVLLSLGTLYVDIFLILFLLKAVFHLFNFIKTRMSLDRYLFFISLGIAISIKVSILPGAVILLISFFIISLKNLKAVILPFFLFLLTFSFWIFENIKFTGYPLGYFPLKIMNLELGKETEAYKWYIHRDELKYSNLKDEIHSFFYLFGLPFKSFGIGFFSFIPLIIYFALFKKFFKENNFFYIVMILFFLSFFILYFHPNFKVVRILWYKVNGRIFLPYFAPIFLLTLRLEKKFYGYFLFFSSLLNLIACLFYGWSIIEFFILPFLFFIFLIFLVKPKYILIILLFLILIIKIEFRNYFINNSIVFHPIPSEWKEFVEILDTKESKKIAITSGPCQNNDNWFLFYIFGKNLQNEIFYIPPTLSGKVIDFDEEYTIKKYANFESWYSRLKRKGITHILSFYPPSIEIEWMSKRPEKFKMLAGQRKSYGLFLLK